VKTSASTLRLSVALALVALACEAGTTGPVTSTLQNDDYDGGTLAYQAGFATGEAVSVRLGPRPAAFKIDRLQFIFGGAATPQTVTLTIYEDAGTANPGTPLYSGDYELTPSDVAYQEIELAVENIVVAANALVRIAFFFQHDGFPTIGHDAGITAAKNLLFTDPGGWVTAESALLPGDFIIRARITTP
jgi:hypothetical protein